MKSLMIGAVCLVAGVIGGFAIREHLQTSATTTPPAADLAQSAPKQSAPETAVLTAKHEATKAVPETPSAPQTAAVIPAVPAVADTKPTHSDAFNRAIATLISTNSAMQAKTAVWKQLREANQLDEALDVLKQGAKDNPGSPAYPTAMGEMELQKAYRYSLTGGSMSQMGIAGMSADADFDAALQLDPSNWEAQYLKAASMSHWPADMNKGPEVIQRFSTLIDLQESQPSQPQFALTYAALGDAYQKAGQPDYALQTWQLGAQKFPGDSTLQGKLAVAQKK